MKATFPSIYVYFFFSKKNHFTFQYIQIETEVKFGLFNSILYLKIYLEFKTKQMKNKFEKQKGQQK